MGIRYGVLSEIDDDLVAVNRLASEVDVTTFGCLGTWPRSDIELVIRRWSVQD